MVPARLSSSPPVRTPVVRTSVEVRWPVICSAVVDRPPVGAAVVDGPVVRAAIIGRSVVRWPVVHPPVGRGVAVISRVAIAVVGGAGRCREPQDASGNRTGSDGPTVLRSTPAPAVTAVPAVTPTITTVPPTVAPPADALGRSTAPNRLNRGHGQGHALGGRHRAADDGCGEQA